MTEFNEDYLEHIKKQIVFGMKKETAKEILEKYSITDQLNASGAEAKAMKTDIKKIVDAGRDKRAAISACTSFEELNKIVPQAN